MSLSRTAVLLPVVALAGCIVLLDADELEGHPCDSNGSCLAGYVCIGGMCVATDTGGKSCPAPCPAGEKCDLREGVCVESCQASVCPSGTGCSAGSECVTIERGIGKPCTADADCASVLSGCNADPDEPGSVVCACFTPVTGRPGVCLGIPSRADDCAACGAARCTTFPAAGLGATVLCVPGGFRPCSAEYECQDPDASEQSHCTYYGWPDDPGPTRLGWVRACGSPPEGAALGVGVPCDAAAVLDCPAGLCVPAGAAGRVCSHGCSDDDDCNSVSRNRCVPAVIQANVSGTVMTDVAPVCGTAPRLGAPCGSGPDDCGTDAPVCGRRPEGGDRVCTRSCADDGDCNPLAGFTCRPDRGECY